MSGKLPALFRVVTWFVPITRKGKNYLISCRGHQVSLLFYRRKNSPIVLHSPLRRRAHDEEPGGDDPVDEGGEHSEEDVVADGAALPLSLGEVEVTVSRPGVEFDRGLCVQQAFVCFHILLECLVHVAGTE